MYQHIVASTNIFTPLQAYFAYLKGVNSSKIMADKIRKNAGDHFSNVIKEGVFQELVGYLTQKNNMKIKANFAEN